MELNKTPLTYQQASELLGVSLETIKKAVLRDVLTRLPREGLYQHLMAGQVQIFKGKMLSLSVLNDSDRKLWQVYADSVNQPVTASTPYRLASNMLHSPGVERATAMTQQMGNAAYSLPVGTSLDAVAQALTRPDVIAASVRLLPPY